MTYEYKCPNCGEKFELFSRTFKHPKTVPCPKCRTDSPQVFSTFGFQFSPYLRELGEGTMLDY